MRPSAVLALAIGLVTLVANLADLLFLDFFGALVVIPYVLGTFAGTGLLLALLRPRHAVGWLFLTGGCCFALYWVLGAYSWRALVDAPGTLPAGVAAAWVNRWVFSPAFALIMAGIVLFPTGRPPSRRGVPLLVVALAVIAASTVADAFAPAPIAVMGPFGGPGEDSPVRATIANPVGLGGPVGDVLLTSGPLLAGFVFPIVLFVFGAVVLRFVRSRGTERLQLKWFFYSASISMALILAAFVGPKGVFADLAWASGVVAMGLVPVAAGIAILRYRLYDIDLVINRTLVYGAVSAMLVATYFAAVIVLQTLLRPFTSGSELAVAGSTLAVVALFQPLRRRIQDAVDRRFYRARYDAARTLDGFSDRLRGDLDLDSVQSDLVEVLNDTVRPAHASVWLRGSPR